MELTYEEQQYYNYITGKVKSFVEDNNYYFEDVNQTMDDVEKILEEEWSKESYIADIVDEGIKDEYKQLFEQEYSELLETVDIESILY